MTVPTESVVIAKAAHIMNISSFNMVVEPLRGGMDPAVRISISLSRAPCLRRLNSSSRMPYEIDCEKG
jgi:hypothetical protein